LAGLAFPDNEQIQELLMRHLWTFLVIILMAITVTACAADKDDLQVKKQPELQQVSRRSR